MENEKNQIKRKTEGELVIDIRTLFSVFMQNIWIIAAAVLGALLIMLIYVGTIKPEYSSTATLYILKIDESSGSGTSNTDFTMASNTINDCKYAISSSAVLDDVLDNLEIRDKYTVSSLAKKITTNNPSSTRFLNVTVQTRTPEESRDIVNEICKVTKTKMSEAQNLTQVNIYSYGKISTSPSNNVGLSKFALVAIAAAVLAYGVMLVIYLVNDTIETDAEFASRIGLTVLGTIPDTSAAEGKKYYGKKYYGKKKYAYGKPYGAAAEKNDGKSE